MSIMENYVLKIITRLRLKNKSENILSVSIDRILTLQSLFNSDFCVAANF